jgi:sugar lactone lactonase YvrE
MAIQLLLALSNAFFIRRFLAMPFSSAIDRSRISSSATSQVISSDSRAAALGDPRSDKRPSKKNCVRWGKCVLALVLPCVSALGEFAPSAEAQTAHFSGAVKTLGSGFSSPYGVAVDGSGNLFVADPANNAVKEILAAGGYTTVNTLGSGFSSPNGVAVDGSGNVFVGDSGNNAVKEILAAGGYTTVNTLGSGFSSPNGVAVDGSANVFVADQGNNAMKEILAASGYTTVNTLGSGFSSPNGVAVDGSANVFVGDSGNNAVKEILAAGGYTTVNTLGSGFSSPDGVAVDGSGNVFVADTGNQAAKEIMTQGVNFGSAAIATSTPPTMQLTFTFDGGGIIGAPAVLTQGAAGLDFADAGTGDTCTATTTYNAGDTCVITVSFTPQFSGLRYGAVTLSDSLGTVIATAHVYGTGLGPQVIFTPGTQSQLGGGFINPQDVAVDGSGNVFVADTTAVKEIPVGCGNTSCVLTLAASFSFNNLPGIAVDGSGNIFVADYGASKVYEIQAAGGYTTVNTLGGSFSFSSPTGVAVDGSGNVFVADTNNNAVEEILAAGGYMTVNTLGGGFTAPQGVAVDGSANVYVADSNNNAVKQIAPGCGSASCVATLGGGFNQPTGVLVDGNGNIFIGDTGNNAVKQMPAGCGSASCVVTLATGFNFPHGVSVDGSGNVYVADSGNTAVVKLDFANAPSLTFASTAVGSTSSDSPQTVTVTNIGNAALTFPVPATGLNPAIDAGFTISSGSTCPQLMSTSSPGTLVAGASCTNLISFTPTVVGSISGSLAMTDNHLNAPTPFYVAQNISLSGTATAGTPTITFTVADHTYSDAPFTVTATSNSTGAFTYTVVSGPATISGSTVTLTGAGTVVLQVSQAADSNYTVATQNVSFNVAALTPAISFTVPNHTYGDAAVTVSATSDSTGTFTYSVVSGPASISGSTVTLTGAGTVVLQASEAADSNYTVATQNVTFTVASATPTISFTVPNHTYGDAGFTVSATSNSTSAFTYTVVSGPATTSGSTVTLTGAGTVVLQASQAANSNYTAATQNATFMVAASTPAILFLVPDHTYGDAPFTLSAVSKSTGSFTYTVFSGPATIAGSTVTLNGAGTVVLQASQAADANYVAATQNITFTVAAIAPTITFNVPNHTYGDAPFTVNATSNSSGAFTYTVVSGPATITGSTVTLTGAGTVVLQASEVASGNYGTTSKNTTFTVAATTPTISFTVANHTFGDAPFTVSATSNSTGAFIYTVVSGPATISGSTVTLTGVGTVVLSASQAGSGNDVAAAANATFTVFTGLTLSPVSGAGSSSGTATVAPGAAATFTIALAPGGSTTYPDPVTFSALGLPPGATATFTPATIPAGSGATSVTLTIQTSSQAAHNVKLFPGSPFAPVTLGFLLLPLAGLKSMCRRLRQMPRLTVALTMLVLSLGALLGLNGCGGGAPTPTATSYTIVVSATDTTTNAHSSINLTLNVK